MQRRIPKGVRRISFLLRAIQLLHLDAAVADKLVCEISASMDLQRDGAGRRMPDFFFLPLHDFNSIDPRRDKRRIAFDSRSQLIPLAVAPKVFP